MTENIFELNDKSYELCWSAEFDSDDGFEAVWKTDNNLLNFNDYCHEGLNGPHGVAYIKNSALHLTAKRDGDMYYGPAQFMTGDSMNYSGGYLEFRARGIATGMFTAFWLQTTEKNARLIPESKKGQRYFLEIDMLETGHSGDIVSTVHHGWGNNGPHDRVRRDDYIPENGKWYNVKNPNEWHNYGMLWSETEIVFYLDGKEIHKAKIFDGYGAKPSEGAAYIIIDAYGSSPEYLKNANAWFTSALKNGVYDENGNYSSFVEIDYIRLYQNPNDSNEKIYVK